MKEITLDQAVKNIEIVVVEHFRGSRAEHMALEHSVTKIRDFISSMTATKSCPTANCDLDVDNTPATC